MKRILLLFAGVIVIGTFAFLVLLATQPTAHLRIYALGPTGEFRPHLEGSGVWESYPVWRFMITNDGAGVAVCGTIVEHKVPGPNSSVAQDQPGWLAGPRLAHRKSATIDMEVPVNTNWIWRGRTIYHTEKSALMQRLSGMERRFPFLWNIDSTRGLTNSFDAWHGPTNVTSAVPAAIAAP